MSRVYASFVSLSTDEVRITSWLVITTIVSKSWDISKSLCAINLLLPVCKLFRTLFFRKKEKKIDFSHIEEIVHNCSKLLHFD